MTTNTKLIFEHVIPIEVYAENTDVNVTIEINGNVEWQKHFPMNEIHSETIEFDKDYDDGSKNQISFIFTGDTESAKRYLKINQLCINKQVLNKYNAEYFPNINKEWWDKLQSEEKNKYTEMIHGRMGDVFGWYGEINFYYCCGFDFRSRFKYNNHNKQDIIRLLDERTNWIYLDENSARGHAKLK